jgi:hypothetical protein
MPRYFFTIHRQDRVEDDRDGTYLPDAEAALSYADYTIRELRKKSGYKDDLSLAMIVEDQAPQTVFILAVFPGLLKLVLVASATRRGGSQPISPSCRSCCAGLEVA